MIRFYAPVCFVIGLSGQLFSMPSPLDTIAFYWKLSDQEQPVAIAYRYAQHMPAVINCKEHPMQRNIQAPFILYCAQATLDRFCSLIDATYLPQHTFAIKSCNAHKVLKLCSFDELITLIQLCSSLENYELLRLVAAEIPDWIRLGNNSQLANYKRGLQKLTDLEREKIIDLTMWFKKPERGVWQPLRCDENFYSVRQALVTDFAQLICTAQSLWVAPLSSDTTTRYYQLNIGGNLCLSPSGTKLLAYHNNELGCYSAAEITQLLFSNKHINLKKNSIFLTENIKNGLCFIDDNGVVLCATPDLLYHIQGDRVTKLVSPKAKFCGSTSNGLYLFFKTKDTVMSYTLDPWNFKLFKTIKHKALTTTKVMGWLLLTIGNNKVKLWDMSIAQTEALVKVNHENISCAAFSEQSGCMVTVDNNINCKLWDIRSGKQLGDDFNFSKNYNRIEEVMFSSDGKQVCLILTKGLFWFSITKPYN